MEKIRGDQIILNGNPARPSEYLPDPSAGMLYEVIRRLDGRLLFAEDHLNRLHFSCTRSGATCPAKQRLYQHLELLTDLVPLPDGNIKLVIFSRLGAPQIACFFVPHFYPAEEDYRTGVKTKSYLFQRPDPTIKRWNEDFRHNVNHFIREEGIYEAILINQEGLLTEGSRSNLFFIDTHQQVITSPDHLILPGITRKYVLEICHQHRINIIEKALHIDEAKMMSSCFLSGTSPKVLPVSQLDNNEFQPGNEVTRKIMAGFDELLQES